MFGAGPPRGSEERGFGGARYGGRIGEGFHYRVYGKGFYRDAGFNPVGREYDAWHMGREGFRVDWDVAPDDALTFQGDAYTGESGRRVTIARLRPPFTRIVFDDGDRAGGNFLGRWTRTLTREFQSLREPPLAEPQAQLAAFQMKSFVLGHNENRRLLEDRDARSLANAAFRDLLDRTARG